MFNDERINYELTKLKKLIIIITSVIALVFLVAKVLTFKGGKIHLEFILTEGAIITSCIVILIGLILKNKKIKDELYYQDIASYINKAFKVFLYIAFISFAVVIPKTATTEASAIYSSNVTINLSMLASLFFGYGYIRYKKIYFNYSIIENDMKKYMIEVAKNILKILKFFGLIYGVSFVISIFYMINYNPLSIIFAIFIGFITSFLTNAIYYLLISLLEKLFFKEEYKKIITTPTLILVILSCFISLTAIGFSIYYYSIANNMQEVNSLIGIFGSSIGEVIANFSNILNSLNEYRRLIGILALTFFLSDILKQQSFTKKSQKLISTVLVILIISTLYTAIYQKVSPILNYYFFEKLNVSSYTQVSLLIMNINVYIKSGVNIVVLFIILKVLSLIKSKSNKTVYFIFWVINCVILICSYALENRTLLNISQFIEIALHTIFIVWTIFYFSRSTNLLKVNLLEGESYE